MVYLDLGMRTLTHVPTHGSLERESGRLKTMEGINLKFKGRVSRRSNCLFKDLHKFIFVPILETERETTFKDCNYMNNEGVSSFYALMIKGTIKENKHLLLFLCCITLRYLIRSKCA